MLTTAWTWFLSHINQMRTTTLVPDVKCAIVAGRTFVSWKIPTWGSRVTPSHSFLRGLSVQCIMSSRATIHIWVLTAEQRRAFTNIHCCVLHMVDPWNTQSIRLSLNRQASPAQHQAEQNKWKGRNHIHTPGAYSWPAGNNQSSQSLYQCWGAGMLVSDCLPFR